MVDQEQLRSFKTIIVGRSSVGKSAILLRFVDGTFAHQNITVAVDYRFKKVTAGGQTFNLELWDTAGQERYKTIVYSFFKLSKAACIVFDLTNQTSFDDIDNWIQQLTAQCGKQIPKIIIGNKSDLLTPADLKQELERIKPKLEKLKQQYDCQFFAVSAKNGENIEKAFHYLAVKLAQQIKIEPLPKKPQRETFRLDDPQLKKQKKKKEKCCN